MIDNYMFYINNKNNHAISLFREDMAIYVTTMQLLT